MKPTAAVAHLIEHGLLANADLLDSRLSLTDLSWRNSTLAVVRDAGQSYVVKQGVGADRAASSAHEARVYELLARSVASAPDGGLARLYDSDPDEHVLTLGWVAGAGTYRAVANAARFSAATAAALGNVLSEVHRTPVEWAGAAAALPLVLPWALALHRPGLAEYGAASAANLELIEIVQANAEFAPLLDELRDGWSASALVHNDLKWDNILVGERDRVVLVDWELAGWGDPCSDIGTLLSEYLSCWLLSMPLAAGMTPAEAAVHASVPLESMRPALRALWAAYRRHAESRNDAANSQLVRSVQLAGARLIQSAYERTRTEARLPRYATALLQLSLNLMQRPADAATRLLGIPLDVEFSG